MNAHEGIKSSIVFRILGLLAIVVGIAFTQARVGDWFFRSGVFSERFASLLLFLRISSAIIGLILIIFGGIFGRKLSRWWNSVSEPGKLVVLTLCLALVGTLLFMASLYFRENMVFIETVTKYKSRFELLGFNVVLQTDEIRASDFLTCIFFAMGSAVAYSMYSLHRIGFLKNTGNPSSSTPTMWLLISLAFFFLVLDEYFGIHEFIGDNIGLINKIKITHHADDMVIGLYFLAGLVMFLYYRRYLFHCRAGRDLLIIGILLHFFATVSDAYIDFYFVEELAEELAIVFYLGAISQYAVHEIMALKRSG